MESTTGALAIISPPDDREQLLLEEALCLRRRAIARGIEGEIEVLRTALNQLLDHAKSTQGDTIDVEEDLYWFVPKDVLNEPANEPAGLTLGSLEDDWSEILAIGTGTKEPFGYGLVWASTILRALGDRTS